MKTPGENPKKKRNRFTGGRRTALTAGLLTGLALGGIAGGNKEAIKAKMSDAYGDIYEKVQQVRQNLNRQDQPETSKTDAASLQNVPDAGSLDAGNDADAVVASDAAVENVQITSLEQAHDETSLNRFIDWMDAQKEVKNGVPYPLYLEQFLYRNNVGVKGAVYHEKTGYWAMTKRYVKDSDGEFERTEDGGRIKEESLKPVAKGRNILTLYDLLPKPNDRFVSDKPSRVLELKDLPAIFRVKLSEATGFQPFFLNNGDTLNDNLQDQIQKVYGNDIKVKVIPVIRPTRRNNMNFQEIYLLIKFEGYAKHDTIKPDDRIFTIHPSYLTEDGKNFLPAPGNNITFVLPSDPSEK
jgi:hypothetical protein